MTLIISMAINCCNNLYFTLFHSPHKEWGKMCQIKLPSSQRRENIYSLRKLFEKVGSNWKRQIAFMEWGIFNPWNLFLLKLTCLVQGCVPSDLKIQDTGYGTAKNTGFHGTRVLLFCHNPSDPLGPRLHQNHNSHWRFWHSQS
jgi:hypothetical protein